MRNLDQLEVKQVSGGLWDSAGFGWDFGGGGGFDYGGGEVYAGAGRDIGIGVGIEIFFRALDALDKATQGPNNLDFSSPFFNSVSAGNMSA